MAKDVEILVHCGVCGVKATAQRYTAIFDEHGRDKIDWIRPPDGWWLLVGGVLTVEDIERGRFRCPACRPRPGGSHAPV
jgi:hypothetical protein